MHAVGRRERVPSHVLKQYFHGLSDMHAHVLDELDAVYITHPSLGSLTDAEKDEALSKPFLEPSVAAIAYDEEDWGKAVHEAKEFAQQKAAHEEWQQSIETLKKEKERAARRKSISLFARKPKKKQSISVSAPVAISEIPCPTPSATSASSATSSSDKRDDIDELAMLVAQRRPSIRRPRKTKTMASLQGIAAMSMSLEDVSSVSAMDESDGIYRSRASSAASDLLRTGSFRRHGLSFVASVSDSQVNVLGHDDVYDNVESSTPDPSSTDDTYGLRPQEAQSQVRLRRSPSSMRRRARPQGIPQAVQENPADPCVQLQASDSQSVKTPVAAQSQEVKRHDDLIAELAALANGSASHNGESKHQHKEQKQEANVTTPARVMRTSTRDALFLESMMSVFDGHTAGTPHRTTSPHTLRAHRESDFDLDETITEVACTSSVAANVGAKSRSESSSDDHGQLGTTERGGVDFIAALQAVADRGIKPSSHLFDESTSEEDDEDDDEYRLDGGEEFLEGNVTFTDSSSCSSDCDMEGEYIMLSDDGDSLEAHATQSSETKQNVPIQPTPDHSTMPRVIPPRRVQHQSMKRQQVRAAQFQASQVKPNRHGTSAAQHASTTTRQHQQQPTTSTVQPRTANKTVTQERSAPRSGVLRAKQAERTAAARAARLSVRLSQIDLTSVFASDV
eukprot:m.251222 g.251222  ORF g.251222 m.251222 type:complete len:679 (-) comp15448_c0_seq4:2944-4980(-)